MYLAIEIDGNSHDEKENYDERRQKRLEELGITVLRFKDFEVVKDVKLVIQKILLWIKEHTPSR